MAAAIVLLSVLAVWLVQRSELKALQELGREDILVVVGGIVPAQDYDFLYQKGVAGIFGPGTKIAVAAQQILQVLLEEVV